MKTVKIELSGIIELTYDEDSPEFKESLEAYKDVMEKDGTKESMLKHVAFYITRFGIHGMVEGVGYVGYNGKKSTNKPYSGIIVGNNYDDFDFEISNS
jgi:hypothetical protein